MYSLGYLNIVKIGIYSYGKRSSPTLVHNALLIHYQPKQLTHFYHQSLTLHLLLFTQSFLKSLFCFVLLLSPSTLLTSWRFPPIYVCRNAQCLLHHPSCSYISKDYSSTTTIRVISLSIRISHNALSIRNKS